MLSADTPAWVSAQQADLLKVPGGLPAAPAGGMMPSETPLLPYGAADGALIGMEHILIQQQPVWDMPLVENTNYFSDLPALDPAINSGVMFNHQSPWASNSPWPQ